MTGVVESEVLRGYRVSAPPFGAGGFILAAV